MSHSNRSSAILLQVSLSELYSSFPTLRGRGITTQYKLGVSIQQYMFHNFISTCDVTLRQYTRDVTLRQYTRDVTLRQYTRDVTQRQYTRDVTLRQYTRDVTLRQYTRDVTLRQYTRDVTLRQYTRDVTLRQYTRDVTLLTGGVFDRQEARARHVNRESSRKVLDSSSDSSFQLYHVPA